MDMDTFMTNTTRNYMDDESFVSISAFNKSKGLLNDITNQAKSMALSTTLIEKQSGIYPEFKQHTNDYIEQSIDLLELIKAYENTCTNQLVYMKKYSQTSSKKRQDTNELEDLENEIQIWKLLCLLYDDHLKHNTNDQDIGMDIDSSSEIFKNEAKLARKLTERNPLLRRLTIIITWLEKTYKDKHLREAPTFVERYINWEHTLHQLNSERKLQGTRDYIDELDPDAPLRLRKPLHDLDQEDEYCLLEHLFKLVRAGDLNAMRSLCLKTGNTWRAATFEGFKLYNDFNYTHLNGEYEDDLVVSDENRNQMHFNQGNQNRDLWKYVVSRIIDNEAMNAYEKAIYASLAGFVRPILPLCKSYVDYIWVYFKALYDQLLEKELKLNMPNNFTEPLNYGHNDQVPQSAINIFEEIRTRVLSSENNVLKAELDKPYLIILKQIILCGLDGFDQGTSEIVEFIRSIIQARDDNGRGQFFRFCAHLALVFRYAEFNFKPETFIEIQEIYVQFLINHKFKQLVAFYLSHVPSEIQIKLYSKFLRTISDNGERTELLQLAKSYNMNIQEITLNIVESLSRQNKEDDLHATMLRSTTPALSSSNKSELLTFRGTSSLSDDDKQKIDSLDWIVNEKSQRVKLVEYANSLMRYFLLSKQNLEATKLVLNKVPQDTLQIIMTQYKCKSEDDLPMIIMNIIKEYVCFKEYIEAMSTFNEWFENFSKKPQKSTADLQVSSFSDRITQDFHQKQFESQVTQWESISQAMCDKASKKFMNVLTFPNGGWMIDQVNGHNDSQNEDLNDEFDTSTDKTKEAKKEEKVRRKQMSTMRKLFIPYVCFVVCEMLHKMNKHKECIRLCDVIASEHYKLYELFDSNQIKSLLNKMADSSLKLVDSKYDVLGY